MDDIKGTVFNIQRFCTRDGDGIRTTVFLKGCPLDCMWCHNPESKSFAPQILYSGDRCIGCGGCAAVCDRHIQTESRHRFDRNGCTACGKCAAVCPSGALEICGKTMSASEVAKELIKDREFYKNSGGGITVSGGEPLLQYDFCAEILRLCKQNGLNTAIETSGYTTKKLDKIISVCDTFLFDIKVLDLDKAKQFTGVNIGIILKNLRYINAGGKDIVLRCPIIKGINLNNSHFKAVALLAQELDNVREVDFLPYHPLGVDKSARLGEKSKTADREFLEPQELTPYIQYAARITDKPLKVL
ncbi:MAG: glycyl-radical enzyme activating protein [Oscillospiraceae bacterium]|nr:glycyl-radical enzyme activating protein [Candidatus Equicaccousia limihippi]